MAKKLTSSKAKEILHDKSVHGHPLTDKQRRFFGAIAGGAEPYAEDGGWLSKYEQGGLVLKKKTKDNYGTKPNVNDAKVSAGPNFVGEGYTAYNWKSPAWGGQFAMGGSLPGSVGFMYARTQNPAPANGKYTKKTLASAQSGKKVELTEEQYYNPPTPTNKSGNTAMDILSSNPWLMKVPGLGNYIKDEAYKNAAMSEGNSTFTPTNDKQTKELTGKGYNAVGKYTGGGGDGYDLLHQYIYGDQNLQASSYSPKDDYLKFLPSYSLKNKAGIKPQSYWKELIFNPALNNRSKDLENVVKTHKSKFYNENTDDTDQLRNVYNIPPDLGHYKGAIAYDEDVNLPYISISDAWDFYPKDYQKMWGHTERERSGDAYQQSYLMHKAGKPFKIYDRFYVDSKTKEPISDKEIIPKKLEKKFTPKGLSERVTQELHKDIDKSYNPYMQNGGEMKYYQDGLDFKPKSISQDGISISTNLKKEAEEKLRRMNQSRSSVSQYTPKPGEAERLDREKLQRIAEENAPLNKFARSKAAKNLQDAAMFAGDVMTAGEVAGVVGKVGKAFGRTVSQLAAERQAAKQAERSAFNLTKPTDFYQPYGSIIDEAGNKALHNYAGQHIGDINITRGPINWWEHPDFSKRNPKFSHEAYLNNPLGGRSYEAKDVPPGLMPYESEYAKGGIVDPRGQWAHPGEVTTIPGNDITMKEVDYDVLGVSNTGDKKLMKPGKDYKFDGDYVTEYPKKWLDKYK